MEIRKALLDDKIKRVIVIAHSQGGIIISMALDDLLSELDRDCIPTWHLT
jgi:esterase/lipase superfamily enzyme